MGKVLSIVAGAGFTVLASWVLGRLLLRRLRVPLFRQEEPLFAFVLGAGLLQAVIFLLALGGLIYDVTFWVLALGLGGIAVWQKLWRSEAKRMEPLPRGWQWFFGVLYTVFAVVYVVNAIAPEMSPDGSTYHLGTVGHYYRTHRMAPMPNHMYAQLSQGVDLLFLMAYAFGRHSAAALTHCAFLLALPLLVLRYGQRIGFAKQGAAAAILVFATPVLGVDGTSAYIDVAMACVLFAVFYLSEIDDRAVSLPLGLLAGYAYAIKYTAALAVPYALFRRRRSGLVLCAVAAALMIAPWVGRNAAWYGNPFAPFGNQLFPNPYVHVSFEQEYGELMRNYVGLESRAAIPMELTVRGRVLGGLLGPLFLAAPLCLLALGSAAGRRVLFAAVWFALPFAANVGTRFLIPAVPFLALAFTLPWARWPAVAAALALTHAVLSYPAVTRKYCDRYAWRIASIPWRAALRVTPEPVYLQDQFAGYRVANMVDRMTAPQAVVYSFAGMPEAYTTREVRTSYQSAENQKLNDLVWQVMTTPMQCEMRREFRMPPRQARRVRVVQTAGNATDLWSVHEMRVFAGGKELARRPEWRLRARPNPWDVQLAFDNSVVTRWRSWQRIEPNMFLEIDFGRVETIDAVALDGSTDQYATRLKLEVDDGSGTWKAAGVEPVDSGLAPTLEMRRQVMEEFRGAGVTHLLVGEGDYGAADMSAKQGLWGLRLVDETAGVRLYKLE
jgi:hypothetical protein